MDRLGEYRPLLLSVAYRMLGSKVDAEDIVQDVLYQYLQREGETIQDLKGFLVRSVMNRAITKYQQVKKEREEYSGPWLPEPYVVKRDEELLPGDRDRLRLGWLKLLENLDPFERAVIVLKEGLGFDHSSIAEFIGRKEENCRQLLKRAKERIEEGNPPRSHDDKEEEKYLQAFVKAAEKGDLDDLRSLLHEDMVFYSDGGGKVPAAIKPLHGRDTVMTFLKGILSQQSDLSFEFVLVNGQPGVVAYNGDVVNSISTLELGKDGKGIGTIHSIRNPDKIGI